MESAVAGMSFGQPLEKRLRHLSQFQKGLSNRLQTVAFLFSLEVIRVFHLFAQPRRIALMPGDELNLGAVDQDFVLRCLEAQDVGDVVGRDGVMVCLKRDETV